MCLIAVFLLLQKKSNIGQHVPYLVLTAVMFVLCTTVRPPVITGGITTSQPCRESPKHVSLSFARLINAFFDSLNPSAYLGDITTVTFRFKHALLFIQVFIGNLLIVRPSQYTLAALL